MILNMDDAQRQRQAINNLLHSQNHRLQQSLNYLQNQQITSVANNNNNNNKSFNEMKQHQASNDHQFAIQQQQRPNFASDVTPNINNNNINNINNNNNNNNNNSKLNNLAAAAAAVVAGDKRSNADSQSPSDNIGSQSVSSRSHLSTSSTPTSVSSPFNNTSNTYNHLNNLQNRQNHQQHQMSNNNNMTSNNKQLSHHQQQLQNMNQFAIHPAHQNSQHPPLGMAFNASQQAPSLPPHLSHLHPQPHLSQPAHGHMHPTQIPARPLMQHMSSMPMGLTNGQLGGPQSLTRISAPPAHSGQQHQGINPISATSNLNIPPSLSTSSPSMNLSSSQRVPLPPPPTARSSPFAPFIPYSAHQPSRPSSATGRASASQLNPLSQANVNTQQPFNQQQLHINNNYGHATTVSSLPLNSSTTTTTTTSYHSNISPPLVGKFQIPAAHQSSKIRSNIHHLGVSDLSVRNPTLYSQQTEPPAAHMSSKKPLTPARAQAHDILANLVAPGQTNPLAMHALGNIHNNPYHHPYPLAMVPPNSVPHNNLRRSPLTDVNGISTSNKLSNPSMDPIGGVGIPGHQSCLTGLKQQDPLNQRVSTDLLSNINNQRNITTKSSQNSNNDNNNQQHTNTLINAIYPNILAHNMETNANSSISNASISNSDPHSSLRSPLNNAAFLSTLANGPSASAMFRLAKQSSNGSPGLPLSRPGENSPQLSATSTNNTSIIGPTFLGAQTNANNIQQQSIQNDPYKFSEQTSALIPSPNSFSQLANNVDLASTANKIPLNMIHPHHQNHPMNSALALSSKSNVSAMSGPLATMGHMAGNLSPLKNSSIMSHQGLMLDVYQQQHQDGGPLDVSKMSTNQSSPRHGNMATPISTKNKNNRDQNTSKKPKLSPQISDNISSVRYSPPSNKQTSGDGHLMDGSNKMSQLMNSSEINAIIINTIDNTSETSDIPATTMNNSTSGSKKQPMTSANTGLGNLNSHPINLNGQNTIGDALDSSRFITNIGPPLNTSANINTSGRNAQSRITDGTSNLNHETTTSNNGHKEVLLPAAHLINTSNDSASTYFSSQGVAISAVGPSREAADSRARVNDDSELKNDDSLILNKHNTPHESNPSIDSNKIKQSSAQNASNSKNNNDLTTADLTSNETKSNEFLSKGANDNVCKLADVNNSSKQLNVESGSQSKYQKLYTKKAWLRNYDQEDQAKTDASPNLDEIKDQPDVKPTICLTQNDTKDAKVTETTSESVPDKLEKSNLIDDKSDIITEEDNDEAFDVEESKMGVAKDKHKQQNDKTIRKMPRRKVKPTPSNDESLESTTTTSDNKRKANTKDSNTNARKKVKESKKSARRQIKESKSEEETTDKRKRTFDDTYRIWPQDQPCYELMPRKIDRCLECRTVRQSSLNNDKQEIDTSENGEKTKRVQSKYYSEDFCRFYEFRKIRYNDRGEVLIVGFLSKEDVREEDKRLWLPNIDCERPVSLEAAKYIIDNIGVQFCLLVKDEKAIKDAFDEEMLKPKQRGEFLTGGIVWRRAINGTRELCDVCSTTLFNMHYVCESCGFVVCVDCHMSKSNKLAMEAIKAKKEDLSVDDENDTKEEFNQAINQNETTNSQLTGINEKQTSKRNKKDRFEWIYCSKNQEHMPGKMTLAQIIAGDCLEQLNTQLHEARERLGLSLCECKLLDKMPVRSPYDSPRPMEIDDGSLEINEIEEDKPIHDCSEDITSLDNDFEDTHDSTKLSQQVSAAIEGCISSLSNGTEKKIETSKDNHDLSSQTANQSDNNQSSHYYLCDGNLLVLNDPLNPTNTELFRAHWKTGRPVLVRGVDKSMKADHWLPQYFANRFGDYRSDLVDCRNGNIHSRSMKKYWDGFDKYDNDGSKKDPRVASLLNESYSSRIPNEGYNMGQPNYFKGPPLWRLKDWPPGQDFKDILPDHFKDFMDNLPLPEYTTRNGDLNLANRLPKEMLMPDLGPKMYCAYGSYNYVERGTTNLHLDISDAVNLLIYVGDANSFNSGGPSEIGEEYSKTIDQCCIDDEMKKDIKNKNLIPGALWHIFNPKDANKIRKFLEREAQDRGLTESVDPIHDQTWYLDQNLIDRLKSDGIETHAILHCLGDAILIPAGAPHQVKNVQNCIKIANDFVSPENVQYCLRLTQEFRRLPVTHINQEDKLQIKNILYHSIKDSLQSISNSESEVKQQNRRTLKSD